MTFSFAFKGKDIKTLESQLQTLSNRNQIIEINDLLLNQVQAVV